MEKWLKLKCLKPTRKERSVEKNIIDRTNAVNKGPKVSERA